MNSKKKGDKGLGAAIGYLTFSGVPVSVPLTDSQDYDLVGEFDGILEKIQVKYTAQRKNGKFVVGLRVLGGNTKKNFVNKLATDLVYDRLFVLTEDGDKFFIPKAAFAEHKNSLVLGEKYDQYRV